MVTVKHYESPLGEILLAADETGLIGLWFMGQKYFARTLPKTYRTGDSPILDSASKWLSIYFSGNIPSFTPPLHLIGTEFQTVVWNHLLSIPYGSPRDTAAPGFPLRRSEARSVITRSRSSFPVTAWSPRTAASLGTRAESSGR